MILDVVIYGDPVLRERCKEVAVIDDDIKTLVANMVETAQYNFRGIGISAPQVGVPIRLFVVCLVEDDEQGNPYYLEPKVYINPKVLSYSEEQGVLNEACLSIPNIRGNVSRPEKIVVEATNIDGKVFQEELKGLEARVFLHENDHLNGVLYIDRISKREKKYLEKALRKLKKQSPA